MRKCFFEERRLQSRQGLFKGIKGCSHPFSLLTSSHHYIDFTSTLLLGMPNPDSDSGSEAASHTEIHASRSEARAGGATDLGDDSDMARLSFSPPYCEILTTLS